MINSAQQYTTSPQITGYASMPIANVWNDIKEVLLLTILTEHIKLQVIGMTSIKKFYI